MMNRIVLWIDEEPDAIHTYLEDIKECFGPEINVLAEPPKRSLEDMLKRIQDVDGLVSLVLDERLRETGEADFTGMQLTEAVRRFDSKLPIYILTNHASDIGDEEFQVESVLAKEDFLYPASKRKIQARVRRQTSLYHDILAQRESRYEELLRKSLAEPLSDTEQDEFNNLHFYRGKAILVSDAATSAMFEKQSNHNKKLIESIESQLAELED